MIKHAARIAIAADRRVFVLEPVQTPAHPVPPFRGGKIKIKECRYYTGILLGAVLFCLQRIIVRPTIPGLWPARR
jgi:hypothetical protein